MLPNVDHPEAFGQHPNADIASQIIETRYFITIALLDASAFTRNRRWVIVAFA